MLITDLMGARDYLPTQREAARILQAILQGLDVRPMPDGTVKFAFEADVEFLDRIAMWGTAIEDSEGERGDNEEGDPAEDCARDLDKLRTAPEVAGIIAGARRGAAMVAEMTEALGAMRADAA